RVIGVWKLHLEPIPTPHRHEIESAWRRGVALRVTDHVGNVLRGIHRQIFVIVAGHVVDRWWISPCGFKAAFGSLGKERRLRQAIREIARSQRSSNRERAISAADINLTYSQGHSGLDPTTIWSRATKVVSVIIFGNDGAGVWIAGTNEDSRGGRVRRVAVVRGHSTSPRRHLHHGCDRILKLDLIVNVFLFHE